MMVSCLSEDLHTSALCHPMSFYLSHSVSQADISSSNTIPFVNRSSTLTFMFSSMSKLTIISDTLSIQQISWMNIHSSDSNLYVILPLPFIFFLHTSSMKGKVEKEYFHKVIVPVAVDHLATVADHISSVFAFFIRSLMLANLCQYFATLAKLDIPIFIYSFQFLNFKFCFV